MEIAPTHRLIEARQFRPQRAWDALDIAEMQGITVRLHWTDTAYRWHVNDGEEVFAVLDGQVDMHVRRGASCRCCICAAATSSTPSPAASIWPIHRAKPASWWWKRKVRSE